MKLEKIIALNTFLFRSQGFHQHLHQWLMFLIIFNEKPLSYSLNTKINKTQIILVLIILFSLKDVRIYS